MHNRTILFVDDEGNILSSIRRALRGEPYKILTAGSGPEALAVLAKEPVQVVVSDQRMPEMTGTEFLAQVKKRHPETVRIVLSGYSDAHAILAAINQGEVFRFLTKPWDAEELKSTLLQCLDQYELLADNRRLHGLVETRLSQLLQTWQELLHQFPTPVLGVSAEGDVVFANQSAAEVLREIPGSGIGTPLESALSPGAMESIRHWLAFAKPGDCPNFRWYEKGIELKAKTLKGTSARGCLFVLEGI